MEDFALLESPKLISRKIGTAVLYFIPCYWNTVWKFHYFSVSQILREINIGDSRIAKSAILTHLEAQNFGFL